MTLNLTSNSTDKKETKHDGEVQEDVKPEIRLLFFGTFFHENTELTADLIQLKEAAQITEVRVIPLGATVDLSTGSFQLGATNPSEFDLEFYYNDLQVPTKSTFELLRHFKFNDKSRIQLVCNSAEQIITDGLLVRGVYSTVTLAVYGFKVDKVPIKELVPEVKKHSPPPQSELPLIVSPPHEEENIKSPEKITELDVAVGVDREAEVLIPLEIQVPAQAIPTITTRVNYDAVQASLEESFSEEQDKNIKDSDKISPVKDTIIVSQIAEVMDTEEISDGEVFPSDEEDDMEFDSVTKQPAGKLLQKEPNQDEVSTSVKTTVDPLIEAIEPISSPPQDQLSDVDDSLLDEFQEPGFEEIISDEEMPDFPDYDYRDWEENWAHKFTRTFNPFSDSFQVSPLQNIKIDDACLGTYNRSSDECWEILLVKAEKMSRDQFTPNLLESWVEDMESLIPLIPSALVVFNVKPLKEKSCIERSLWFWVEIGTNLKLAVEQPSLPFKTRHIKAGVRLIQCLANCGGHIANSLVKLEFSVEENDKELSERSSTDNKISVQHRLMDLLKQPHMNNVTKLSILRTLDATTSTKLGFEKFTTVLYEGMTSYQRLLECSMNPGFSARMSFSFRSLQKKMLLLEGLLDLETFVKEFANRSFASKEHTPAIDSVTLEKHLTALEDLVWLGHHIDQYFSHPLRILPAKSVVELPPLCSTGYDPKVSLVKLLKETNFIQLAAVLVNSKEVSGKIVSLICELLIILLNWEAGVIYLCNESDSVTILLRYLLQLDDETSGVASLAAHCTEVIKCVDILSSDSYKTDLEEDRDEDVRILQIIVSLLMTSVGREALVKTLSKGNFIVPFLKCIKASDTDSRFGKLSRLERSVRKGYALEILEFVIRSCESVDFLQKHGPTLYNTISSLIESNEGCEKLLDVQPFLKPTLNPVVFTLDGIEALCDIIKAKKDDLLQTSRNPENNWGFPAEMITSLRILCELVTSPEDNDASKNLLLSTDEMLIRELKYDLALVQIHSLDMITTFLAILQKIVDELLQPTIHAHVFVSSRGDTIVNLLLPLIKVLKRSICQVIQVRKTDFRDVSAVPILIKVYGLVENFPSNSLSYSKAQEISQSIIGILLAYTVPAIKIGTETEDELNKSTWTAVIAEIIKFTLEEPANFQTGLSLLTEMLPLPLPIASKTVLSEETCLESVKLRRLWSAYIHGLSPQIQEMIGILCGSTNARLLNLLKRVCVQLADLSCSSCLVVCRAILDAILQSMELEVETNIDSQTTTSQISSVKAWLDMSKGPGDSQCSAHTTRLLGFLASLVNNYSPIKCGVLHTMKGSTKIDEKYNELLNFFCSILLTTPTSSSHIQGQDHVVTIFQSFCDVEINMLIPIFGRTEKTYEPDFILANSLPQREHLVAICSTLVSYLSQMDTKVSNTGQILEGILRTLEIIAETDYGFYHLRTSMDKKSGSLSKIAKSLASNEMNNSDNFESLLPCIMSFLDLLKSVTTARSQQMGSFPPRYNFLKPDELIRHLEWNVDENADSNLTVKVDDSEVDLKQEKSSSDATTEKESDDKKSEVDDTAMDTSSKDVKSDVQSQIKSQGEIAIHPLVQLKNFLEKQLSNLRDGSLTLANVEPNDLEIGLQIFNTLFQLMKDAHHRTEAESGSSFESALPSSETLLELFSLRPVSVIVDKMGNDNLPIFWLTSVPPAFELDTDNSETELVTCDLEELSRTYLNGFDVAKEIQNLAKASDLQASCGKDEIKPGETKYASGARAPTMSLSHMHRRPQYNNNMRGGNNRGIYGRGLLPGPGRMGGHGMYDPFRSRPPNTSRPPSLHVDDFVALESSGQPGPQQLRSSGTDNFNSRGRGNQRGGLLTRPFSHDRGRNMRPGQASGGYYQNKRHESPGSSQGRGSRGGRIYTTPTSDRWTADNRGGPQNYDRNNRSANYEDKYRTSSIGPNRSGVSAPRNHNQPYPQRTGYRDARQQGGANNSPRWRDRQNNRPFNR